MFTGVCWTDIKDPKNTCLCGGEVCGLYLTCWGRWRDTEVPRKAPDASCCQSGPAAMYYMVVLHVKAVCDLGPHLGQDLKGS